jgi:hypothetical protein
LSLAPNPGAEATEENGRLPRDASYQELSSRWAPIIGMIVMSKGITRITSSPAMSAYFESAPMSVPCRLGDSTVARRA